MTLTPGTASDWYVAVFACALVGAMLAAGLTHVTVPLAVTTAGGTALSVLVACLLAGGGLVAWLFGPLTVPGPELWWVFSSGLDRAALLHRPFGKVVVAAAVVGVAAGTLLWLVWAPAGAWVVAAALTPMTATTLALVHQQHRGLHLLPFGGLGLSVLLAVLRAPWMSVGLLVAVTVGLGVLAWRGLGGLSRFELQLATRFASGVGGGALGLDVGLLLNLVQCRTSRPARARLRGAGRGWRAMAWVDVQRVARRDTWLVLGGILAVDALCVAAAGAAPAQAVWAAALLMPVLAGVMSMRRRIALASGLRHALPAGGSFVLASSVGAVAVAMLNVALLAVFLVVGGVSLPGAVATSLVVNGSAVVGAWRLAAVAPPDFSTGLVVTEAGVLPLGALFTALRG